MELENREYFEAGAPQTARQLDQFVDSLCEIGGENLLGVYLHGSLAMRCFQPGRSDLDLLVLLAQPLTPEQRRACAQMLLQLSGAPSPIEISFLHRRQFEPWRRPTPFDFHFSEAWRTAIADDLATGAWERWGDTERVDEDLAAHFTVALRRGVVLWQARNAPPFPQPPWEDYLHSIIDDLLWARRQLAKAGRENRDDNGVYLILNACRVWAAVSDRLVLSKAEGATWAAPRLPPPSPPIGAKR